MFSLNSVGFFWFSTLFFATQVNLVHGTEPTIQRDGCLIYSWLGYSCDLDMPIYKWKISWSYGFLQILFHYFMHGESSRCEKICKNIPVASELENKMRNSINPFKPFQLQSYFPIFLHFQLQSYFPIFLPQAVSAQG